MRANPPSRTKHLSKLCGHKSCGSRDINFSNCHVLWCWWYDQSVTWQIRVVVNHGTSAPGLFWCQWVFYKTTSLRGHMSYEYNLLAIFYLFGKFCDHKHCDSRDIMFYFLKWPHVATCVKGHANSYVQSIHGRLLPCHVFFAIGLVEVKIWNI